MLILQCFAGINLSTFIYLFIFPDPICLLSIKSNLVKYSIGGVAGVRYGVIVRACIELDPFIKKERNLKNQKKKKTKNKNL